MIDRNYTPFRSKITMSERMYLAILERRLQRRDKDVRAENDLLNDLGFNLCVTLQSLVMRLVAYFRVMGSRQDRGPKRSSEGVRVDKTRLGPDNVNLQTEELHCNYSVLIGSPE